MPACQDPMLRRTIAHGRVRRMLVKKYGNRRMYDTTGSRYVNLDDLAALVREGKDVKVVDAKTGKDLTRVTLTQIITEDAKDQPTGLPLELLRQLVLVSDSTGHQFLEWYLKNAMEGYQKVRESLQNRFQEVQQAAVSPVETILNLWRASPIQTPERREVEALHGRVEELEKRLLETAQPKAPRRSPTGKRRAKDGEQ